MGKGSQRRPTAITPHEEELRWQLAAGEITSKEYEKRYKELKRQGKIYRRF